MLSTPTRRLPETTAAATSAGSSSPTNHSAPTINTIDTPNAFAPMVARAGRSPVAARRRPANGAAAAAPIGGVGNDAKSMESVRGVMRPFSLHFALDREEELWRKELGHDFWVANIAIRFFGLPPIQFALTSLGVIALTVGRTAGNRGNGISDISLILSAIAIAIQLLLVALLFYWGSNGRSANQRVCALLFTLAGGIFAVSHTISTSPLTATPSSAGVIVYMLSSLLIASHFLFAYLAICVNLITLAYVIPVIEARWNPGDSMGVYTIDSLQIILASIVLQITAREYERVRRSIWVNEQRLREKQQEQATVDRERIALRAEVFGLTLEKFNIAEMLDDKMDFETPLEKAMALLQGVVDLPELPKPVFDKIKEAVLYLGKSNDNLFRPQIEQQLAHRKVNEDTARWIRNMIGEGEGEGSAGGTRISSATLHRVSPAGGVSDDLLPGSVPTGISIVVESKEELAVQTMLQNLDDWNFDIFELMRLTHGKPMLFMSMAVFKKYNLISHFKLDSRKLSAFFEKIERGYNDMPYHNCVHAADVTHSVNYFLGAGRLSSYMNEEEILSALVASAIHDHDHPGRNNNYCIAVSEPRALLYNDKSVLENHHLASSFAVLMKEEYNMLSHLPSKTYKNIRKIMIEMVLATDLSHHFDLVGQFQTAIKASNFDKKAEKNRLSILRMALKCGDLGHAAKRLDLHLKWTSRYTEESFRQGDDERKHGIPISPFMDRSNFNLPQSQQGFMTFLVLPMYEVFTNFLIQDVPENKDNMPCLTQVIINRDHWKNEFERGQKQQTRAADPKASNGTAATTPATTTTMTPSAGALANNTSTTGSSVTTTTTTTSTNGASTTANTGVENGLPRQTGSTAGSIISTTTANAPSPALTKQSSNAAPPQGSPNGTGNGAFANVVVAGRSAPSSSTVSNIPLPPPTK